ncbi:hypothetical protein EBU60_04655 [bacterium]|nr:hypothetical protein [bacterium]
MEGVVSHLDLRDEVERLRERVQDYEDDARTVLAERCAPDERHCSCVPHLRREVERLRAENEQQAREVAYLRACVPPSHPSDYGYEAWGWRLRAEVAAERAAVVAFLREGDTVCMECGDRAVLDLAYRIECSEHRRQEEP